MNGESVPRNAAFMVFVLTLGLAVTVASSQQAKQASAKSADAAKWRIEFCAPEIPRVFEVGYANLMIGFTFQVHDGRPSGVTVYTNDSRLDTAEFESCLKRWRFPEVPAGTAGKALFRWTHAIGWRTLELNVASAGQVIELSGKLCPY